MEAVACGVVAHVDLGNYALILFAVADFLALVLGEVADAITQEYVAEALFELLLDVDWIFCQDAEREGVDQSMGLARPYQLEEGAIYARL